VDVTNTGTVAGKEVIQVYVHDHQSRLIRPPKELKGFAKIELQPGETKTVAIALDFRAFAYYNPAYKQWITEDGEFDILIGSSSADIHCTETVTLESSLTLPSVLDDESTVRDWLEDPKGKVVFGPTYEKMKQRMRGTFGDGASDQAIGMDMTGFMLEMPVLSLLQFQQKSWDRPVHEIVADLLRQVHDQ
jgi:beta-glucosidase